MFINLGTKAKVALFVLLELQGRHCLTLKYILLFFFSECNFPFGTEDCFKIDPGIGPTISHRNDPQITLRIDPEIGSTIDLEIRL